jgi:hypothetical protein
MDPQVLLNILMTQDFADWYASEFEDYVTGEEDAPSGVEVLNTLQQFISVVI